MFSRTQLIVLLVQAILVFFSAQCLLSAGIDKGIVIALACPFFTVCGFITLAVVK